MSSATLPNTPAGTDYGDFRHQQEPDPVRRRRRIPPFYEERERRAPRNGREPGTE